MKDFVPLLAAFVAAIVAISGYWFTNRSKQLDVKADSYGKALAAVENYKQLPYRIFRRTNDPKARANLAQMIDDILQEIAFYRRWLFLDSKVVGHAYQVWVSHVYKKGSEHRKNAWMSPPMTDDKDMNSVPPCPYNDTSQQEAVYAAMARQLRKPWRA